MKNIITIAILIFAFATYTLYPEIIELSPRIGETILPAHRNYFGLFPNTDNFQSARIIKNSPDNFTIEIITEKTSVSYNVHDNLIKSLASIINNFEKIINKQESFSLKVDNDLIKDYIKVNTRIEPGIKSINIKLNDGSVVNGRLLYIDDTKLILYQSSENYDYTTAGSFIKVVNCTEISSIDGADYPVVKGNSYILSRNRKSLSDYLLFKNNSSQDAYPPELIRYVSDTTIKTPDIFNHELDDFYFNSFYLSGFSGLNVFNIREIPMYIYSFKFKLDFKTHFSYGIEAGYNIFKNLSASVNYNYSSMDYYIDGDIDPSNNRNVYNYHEAGIKLSYNFYKTKLHYFESNQFLFDFYTQISLIKYSYFDFRMKQLDYPNLSDINQIPGSILNNIIRTYGAGFTLRYKISMKENLFFSIGGAYYDNFGSISIYNYIGYYMTSKDNIGFLINYSALIGYTIQF